jgi:TonB-dependent SusC/RagA subfamily outer membrane receptor
MTRTHATAAAAALGWLTLAAGCSHATRAAPRAVAAWEDSVAVGYGLMLRRDVTGPVSSVSFARDAERPRVAHVEELLVGRVPGLDVSRVAGGEYSVRVRGGNNLGGEPLWVIDGMPAPQGISPRALLAGIDPSGVARIDVLKGSAASIYGMRGLNGVIVITMRGARR